MIRSELPRELLADFRPFRAAGLMVVGFNLQSTASPAITAGTVEQSSQC